jgi:acyl dehydratase
LFNNHQLHGVFLKLSTPIYFEDLDKFATFRSDEITITAEEIRKYATQFDPQPYHTDRSAAEGSIFGGLCASGWHVCAIMMKLLSNVMAKENIMLIGSDNVPSLKWLKPAFEGNKLHAELEFKGAGINKTEPDFGVINCDVKVLNENNQLVMEVKTTLMVENKGINSE